jgi:hypothetical protein
MTGIMNMFVGGGSGGPASFTVTNGSYYVSLPLGNLDYFYGWSSILYVSGGTPTYSSIPDTTYTAGSSSPTTPLFYNAPILGMVSEDTTTGGTSNQAYLYTLILAGNYSYLNINTLSIGGTSVSIASQTTTFESFTYSPAQANGITYIKVTPTVVSTTLFTTTLGANKAVIIT